MTVRIATFNAENLFARYRFRQNYEPSDKGGFTINNLAFRLLDEEAKRLTGKAIREVDADVICLQEVESLPVLERFNSRYLGGRGYKHRLVVDGHDPRAIDVAVLSRYPFVHIGTHRSERNAAGTTWLFSRDCLEVDVNVDGKVLSLYVHHLKSMIDSREESHERRKEQAQRAAAIVDEWWEGEAYQGNYIVLGDLNDYMDADTALTALLTHPALVNVVDRLPEEERWTHYWAEGNEYRQLDYLLVSKVLAEENASKKPKMLRKGLPWRAEQYTGQRYSAVGENEPKASDHVPLYMDLNLL